MFPHSLVIDMAAKKIGSVTEMLFPANSQALFLDSGTAHCNLDTAETAIPQNLAHGGLWR